MLAWAAGGCSLFRPLPLLPQQEVVAAMRRQAGCIRTVTDGNISVTFSTTGISGLFVRRTVKGHIGFDARCMGLFLGAGTTGADAFSLKALGLRFWLALPNTREVVIGGPAAYAKLPFLVAPQEIQALFAGPDWLGLSWPGTGMSVEGGYYRFDVPLLGVVCRRVLVDRRQLSVAEMEDYDVLGQEVLRVRMADLVPADGTQFPLQWAFERPSVGIMVTLRLRQPAFNKDLAVQAFMPGERPGWTVVDLDTEPLSAVQAFAEE
jgi:hypothetical protein